MHSSPGEIGAGTSSAAMEDGSGPNQGQVSRNAVCLGRASSDAGMCLLEGSLQGSRDRALVGPRGETVRQRHWAYGCP
jgi:hypothetical protein